jgi:hypothetical protein
LPLPLSLLESLKNGLKCIYPKSENYKFLNECDEILFYENIHKLKNDDFIYKKNINSEKITKILSATYKDNLDKLFNIDNEREYNNNR